MRHLAEATGQGRDGLSAVLPQDGNVALQSVSSLVKPSWFQGIFPSSGRGCDFANVIDDLWRGRRGNAASLVGSTDRNV